MILNKKADFKELKKIIKKNKDSRNFLKLMKIWPSLFLSLFKLGVKLIKHKKFRQLILGES